jgi:L-seryl-tRNA(Ser) seleniumtransferase
MGADIVCYGAKYFGAPHSAGILSGRKDLVESAKKQGFIGFEANPFRSFGRPLKLDRQEIIAVVVALQEWMAMDHEARFATYDKRVKNLQKAFEGVANVEATPQPESGPAQNLRLTLDESALDKTAADIAAALKEGNPRILLHTNANTINISTRTIVDGDEQVIADRIKNLL